MTSTWTHIAVLSAGIVLGAATGLVARASAPLPAPALLASPSSLTSERGALHTRPERDPIVRIVFVGDIMPSRFVAEQLRRRGDRSYWLSSASTTIRSADLAIGNLESPITRGAAVPNGSMVFRTDPEFTPTLRDAGFDALILANNHAMDHGPEGLSRTFRSLASSSLAWAGAGTSGPAYAPRYLDADGLLVALIAQNDRDVVPPTSCAGEAMLGTACFDHDKLEDAIRSAKERGAFVIASMHSGTEYQTHPNARQRAWASVAANAGADLVVGHHPHVIQPSEVVGTSTLAYWSLGNFLFDQSWSKETTEGLLIAVSIDRASNTIAAVDETSVSIEHNVLPRLGTTTRAWVRNDSGELTRAQ
jgi:poly-gamma-glutamate synthesis protein (capsule biosynthesis protein)